MKLIFNVYVVLVLILFGQNLYSFEAPNLNSLIGVYRGDSLGMDSKPAICEVRVSIPPGEHAKLVYSNEYSKEYPKETAWFFNHNIIGSTSNSIHFKERHCPGYCVSNEMTLTLAEGKIANLDDIFWTWIGTIHYTCRNIHRVN